MGAPPPPPSPSLPEPSQKTTRAKTTQVAVAFSGGGGVGPLPNFRRRRCQSSSLARSPARPALLANERCLVRRLANCEICEPGRARRRRRPKRKGRQSEREREREREREIERGGVKKGRERHFEKGHCGAFATSDPSGLAERGRPFHYFFAAGDVSKNTFGFLLKWRQNPSLPSSSRTFATFRA